MTILSCSGGAFIRGKDLGFNCGRSALIAVLGRWRRLTYSRLGGAFQMRARSLGPEPGQRAPVCACYAVRQLCPERCGLRNEWEACRARNRDYDIASLPHW